MALVPIVETPCPIRRPLAAGASDHCSVCDRAVHNLDRMNERERIEFMNSCGGKVCVAYTVRIPARGLRKRQVVGAAVAVAAIGALASLPAAADGASIVEGMSPVSVPADANGLRACDDFSEVVITGGVTKGDEAAWKDDGKSAPPVLPTVEDDGR